MEASKDSLGYAIMEPAKMMADIDKNIVLIFD
jgi:hypothetical protein